MNMNDEAGDLEFEQDDNLLTEDEIELARGIYGAFDAEIAYFIGVTEKSTGRRRCMIVAIEESEDGEDRKMLPIGIVFNEEDDPLGDYEFPFIVEHNSLDIDTTQKPITKELGWFSRAVQKVFG